MASTIKDVAKLAGVSTATVSRIINNKGYFSNDAEKRVKEAIAELSYTPNEHARHVVNRRLTTIGVILPSLDNPLYSELFEDVEQNLSLNGYQALLCISNNQQDKEEAYIKLLKESKVGGIITGSHSDLLIGKLRRNYPIVAFDRQISRDIPAIKSDNLSGGKAIAQLVCRQGIKNVLILSGSKEDFYPINDRVKGMLGVFNHAGIDVSTSALDFGEGFEARRLLIKKLIVNHEFDAICCTDDITAVAVKRCVQEENYHPIVTGYDGSKFIRNFFPDLPTVRQPIQEMAQFLVECLMKRINRPDDLLEKEYVFPVKTVGQSI